MKANGNEIFTAINGNVCDCANEANGYIFVNETAPAEDVENAEEAAAPMEVSSMPALIFLITNILGVGWVIFTMFYKSFITTGCGFMIGSWMCAANNMNQIVYWFIPGVEMVLFFMSMLSFDNFRIYQFYTNNAGLKAAFFASMLPVLFYLLGLVLDPDSMKWTDANGATVFFAGSIVMWFVQVGGHYFFMDDFNAYARATYPEEYLALDTLECTAHCTAPAEEEEEAEGENADVEEEAAREDETDF